jgi:catechol 2,3-dioxygenase
MSAGNYHHHLGVNTWAGPLARPAPSAEAQLLWWDLLLPSTDAIEGVVQSLADRAYTVTGEGVDAGRLARDPWGMTVRLTTAV